MDKTPHPNPRARLQQLQAIPERDRTEEQWDEMNEIEIMLAAGNRKVEAAHRQGQQHRSNPTIDPNRPNQGGGPGGPGGPDRKQGRKFHKRPPRRKP